MVKRISVLGKTKQDSQRNERLENDHDRYVQHKR